MGGDGMARSVTIDRPSPRRAARVAGSKPAGRAHGREDDAVALFWEVV